MDTTGIWQGKDSKYQPCIEFVINQRALVSAMIEAIRVKFVIFNLMCSAPETKSY